MEKVFVARKVAQKLFATEAALDTAITEAAELMAEMLKARRELGLSAVVGDNASAKLVEALAALGEARTAVVAAHGELDQVRVRIGVRTKGLGFEDKPPQFAQLVEAADVREVG
ncbi:MAG TPA: hypothetical protein PLF78_00835 [Caulobacter sp.]|nr:hypothetical protein [Caulobacter sp.]